MAQSAPLVNGINYAWVDITLIIFGINIRAVTSVEWDVDRKADNNYGTGDEPVSRGYGAREYTAAIEIYQDEWRKIIDASDGDPLSIPPFSVITTFGASRGAAKTTTLLACDFLKDAFKAAQGDTKLTVKLPLLPGGIVHT